MVVLLADGTTKSIEEVSTGDKVLATDPDTGRTKVEEVAGTIVTEDDEDFVTVSISADGGSSSDLVATANHPFWAEQAAKWGEAGDLRPGMEVRTSDGTKAKVVGTRAFHHQQRTHDLTIDDLHT